MKFLIVNLLTFESSHDPLLSILSKIQSSILLRYFDPPNNECNVFGQLEQILQSKHGSFWSMFGEPDIDGEMYDSIVKCLNSEVVLNLDTNLDFWLHQIFIEKKCIKTPNVNAEGFLTKFYPTEKYLKKNNRKLVQSVLDLLDMKDNFTIKLLHKYPFINIRLLKTLHSLLGGSKYVNHPTL